MLTTVDEIEADWRECKARGCIRAAPPLGVGVTDRAPVDPTYPRTAASIAATSIFFIRIIASNARFATSPPLAIASVRTRGVICHDRPHLSLHQPHALSAPPLPTIAFQ